MWKFIFMSSHSGSSFLKLFKFCGLFELLMFLVCFSKHWKYTLPFLCKVMSTGSSNDWEGLIQTLLISPQSHSCLHPLLLSLHSYQISLCLHPYLTGQPQGTWPYIDHCRRNMKLFEAFQMGRRKVKPASPTEENGPDIRRFNWAEPSLASWLGGGISSLVIVYPKARKTLLCIWGGHVSSSRGKILENDWWVNESCMQSPFYLHFYLVGKVGD